MKTVVFQPFTKVWTPRTPDSNYDSLGPAPVDAIVSLTPPVTEWLSQGVIIEQALYETATTSRSSSELAGYGVTLHAATYHPAS